jgi:hypothetical protein
VCEDHRFPSLLARQRSKTKCQQYHPTADGYPTTNLRAIPFPLIDGFPVRMLVMGPTEMCGSMPQCGIPSPPVLPPLTSGSLAFGDHEITQLKILFPPPDLTPFIHRPCASNIMSCGCGTSTATEISLWRVCVWRWWWRAAAAHDHRWRLVIQGETGVFLSQNEAPDSDWSRLESVLQNQRQSCRRRDSKFLHSYVQSSRKGCEFLQVLCDGIRELMLHFHRQHHYQHQQHTWVGLIARQAS